MTVDRLDDFVRSATVVVEPSDQRVDRLLAAVAVRIEARPPTLGERLTTWAALPIRRYALPMAVAAAIGGLVGATLPERVDQQSPLLTLIRATSALQPLGF